MQQIQTDPHDGVNNRRTGKRAKRTTHECPTHLASACKIKMNSAFIRQRATKAVPLPRRGDGSLELEPPRQLLPNSIALLNEGPINRFIAIRTDIVRELLLGELWYLVEA